MILYDINLGQGSGEQIPPEVSHVDAVKCWTGLQTFEGSTRLDVQESSLSWLTVDASYPLGAQLSCQSECIEVAPTYDVASSTCW